MNPLPSKCLKPGFKKTIAPPIDSDFFPTQTEIKTFGALSQGLCGCRKELKLKKVLKLFKQKDFDSHSE